MQSSFKDLNAEGVGRLINPTRSQVGLKEMLRDGKFIQTLTQRQAAIALTVSAKVIKGELQWVDGHYRMHCPAGKLQIQNRQLLIVIFSAGGKEFFVQAQALYVYGNYVELGALDPRYYERHPITAPINIWPIPDHLAQECAAGVKILRRRVNHLDPDTGIFYGVHDLFAPDIPVLDEVMRESNALSGTLQEMSLGGCSLKLNPGNHSSLVNCKLAYIETSMDWGKFVGNLSAFVCVRNSFPIARCLTIRCTFLEALPQLGQKLKDASRSFSLEAPGACMIKVNGQLFPFEKSLQLHLPSGWQDILVRWPDGTAVQQGIMLGKKSEGKILFHRPEEKTSQTLIPKVS